MNPPLSGHRVVVTRAEHQASDLERLLQAAGASVISFPTIAIVAPEDNGVALNNALDRIESYSWVVFTSANAVERTLVGLRKPWPATVRVAVIGQATREVLYRHGITPHLMAADSISEGVLSEFASLRDSGGSVLLPRAAVARDVLPNGLRDLGYEVDVVEAYRTVAAQPSENLIANVRKAGAVTFTSSSAVRNFVALVPDLPAAVTVATIGPVTSETVTASGLHVGVEATERTMAGLVTALSQHFSRR